MLNAFRKSGLSSIVVHGALVFIIVVASFTPHLTLYENFKCLFQVSPNNVSSWRYSDTRREYYYAPFNKPHLNFQNNVVIDHFSKVIEKFLAIDNVKGISLRNAAFLLVDSSFQNEEVNSNLNPDLTLNQYGFFKHSKTENLPQLGPLLHQWRQVIRNKTLAGLLMVAEDLSKVESYKVNGTLVVDMPLQSHILSKTNVSVNETAGSLNYTFNINGIEWPLWEVRKSVLTHSFLGISPQKCFLMSFITD